MRPQPPRRPRRTTGTRRARSTTLLATFTLATTIPGPLTPTASASAASAAAPHAALASAASAAATPGPFTAAAPSVAHAAASAASAAAPHAASLPGPVAAAPGADSISIATVSAAGPAAARGGLGAGSAGGVAGDPKVVFKVSDPRINESSGLAVSRRHQGVIYTHNDSGGVAQIFALGPDGSTRAVLTLAGAGARDWEGMAMGQDEKGRPAIYVADIGDNLGGAWPFVTVYRIPEPARLRSQTVRATSFKLKYEDGPRNAETMMINPRTNRLYVASKLFSGALYEAPARLRSSGYNKLRKVADAPAIATDGAFAPDGRSYVIRTYFGARIYSVKDDGRPGKSLRSIGLPAQEQGESVTYSPDGRSLLVGSEGGGQPVYEVPLPESAIPSPKARPGAKSGGKDDADEGSRDSKSTGVGLFVALGIAAAVGYGVLRKRS
ncbi:hypothetical protein ACGFNU_45805 [Spirillospora sp. NPDC048911]|uniref:hypothetical protein n=1 Tax=Spirillospora sp. NPDC048911 TaxID=3364527 RepID=UPI00371FF5CA